MLSYLKVTDLALIENVEIDFRAGFNVLSGETGAGKTVLVGAITLLLGDRAESMMVRTGASEAVLEASFDLTGEERAVEALVDLGYLEEGADELTLGRRIPREGKSKCTVNGRLSPVSALGEIGSLLVEVHGQNTHQALLKQATHIGYLDRYAGAAHLGALASYRESYARLRSLISERLKVTAASAGEPSREMELLAHEVGELGACSLEDGEMDEVEARASRLRHGAELWDLASRAAGLVSASDPGAASAREMLTQASEHLSRMAERDSSLAPLRERLESLALEAEDAASELERYADGLDTDPSALAQAEDDLSRLREVCRKYGGSIEAAREYLERARERLGELEGIEERREVIDAEIARARSECADLAGALSAERAKAAVSLAEAVVEQMSGLGLESAAFAVEVRSGGELEGCESAERLGPDGADEVEFLFAPDSREPARPLRKIASGGEMSRVMLAVKIVLAEADRLPVLIYDEVDAGIGGETAATVGEKLYELTRYHQVFCVTHLPQIASFADWQYVVVKDSDDGGSRTRAIQLDADGRVSEICRMLGDSTGRKATESHARDILATAASRKKGFS